MKNGTILLELDFVAFWVFLVWMGVEEMAGVSELPRECNPDTLFEAKWFRIVLPLDEVTVSATETVCDVFWVRVAEVDCEGALDAAGCDILWVIVAELVRIIGVAEAVADVEDDTEFTIEFEGVLDLEGVFDVVEELEGVFVFEGVTEMEWVFDTEADLESVFEAVPECVGDTEIEGTEIAQTSFGL